MIGIDFGTTQTKASFLDASGNPNTVLNSRGEERTPTVVHISGSILIGTDAVEQGCLDPERCLRSFKLNLGTTDSLLPDGKIFTATDATAVVVAQIKKDTEKATGKELTQCVATCPANFHDDQKQALIEAFERNGIKVLNLIPEPTAAAIAYKINKRKDRQNIMIYDFGGGTFDVSIVKIVGSQVTVLSTEGVAKLGGNVTLKWFVGVALLGVPPFAMALLH